MRNRTKLELMGQSLMSFDSYLPREVVKAEVLHVIARADAWAKPAVPAVVEPVAVLVDAVKYHAAANYGAGGWDFIVECWSDADIAEAIEGAKTVKGAIRKAGQACKLLGDARQEAVAS